MTESSEESILAPSSPSSPPPPPPSTPAGRPRKSPVWRFFLYDDQTGKSTCQVEIPSGDTEEAGPSTRICGHESKGKFPTNLKQHLKKKHPHTLTLLAKEEEKRKKKSKPQKNYQRTIHDVFRQKSLYHKESERYKIISKKLAVFIGSSSVPIRLVENPELRSLLQTLDPRYDVPGRNLMGKQLDQLMEELKVNIKLFLSSAQRISLCADIWSKRGLTSSYLGITAHFFGKKDHKRHRVTLAVRKFPHPHTGERVREVVEEVLKQWAIPVSKIIAILTDNGSNMVKAFKARLSSIEDNEEMDDDQERDSEEDEEVSHEDLDHDEDEELETDFDIREDEHEMAFFSFIKRVSCFAHTLQLIVHKFDDVSAVTRVLKSAHTLVKKVNKSSKATEKLVMLSGKKLISDCPTRWSSTYLMIERLLALRGPLSTVLDELGMDSLATSEWKSLHNINSLLKPFAQYTSLVGGEEYTTISSIIPIIMELNLHLEESKKKTELLDAASVLLVELKRRFRKFTDPGDPEHDPLFLVCTMLDPRYRVLLNPLQRDSAKEQLLKLLKEQSESNGSSSNATHSPQSVHTSEDDEPSAKRFCHLSQVIKQRLQEDKKKTSKKQPGEQELDQYLESGHSLSDDSDQDPVTFWVQQHHTYPLLAALAVDMLNIPGSSTPIERVFSTAGEATAGKRNRLSDKNLEREVLLRKNKDYIFN